MSWLTTRLITPGVRNALEFYNRAMEMVSIAEVHDARGQLLFAPIRYRGMNLTVNKDGWYADLPSPITTNQPVRRMWPP